MKYKIWIRLKLKMVDFTDIPFEDIIFFLESNGMSITTNKDQNYSRAEILIFSYSHCAAPLSIIDWIMSNDLSHRAIGVYMCDKEDY